VVDASETRAAAARGPRRALSPHGLGRRGEDLACEHLERRGFAIVERNARTRSGEIDIVAFDGSTLVFAEVKSRRAPSAAAPVQGAGPLEGLGVRQQAHLRRLAAAWLCRRARGFPYARTLRLDAIGVTMDPAGRLLKLEHLEGAW
jgi:putative endonuclease